MVITHPSKRVPEGAQAVKPLNVVAQETLKFTAVCDIFWNDLFFRPAANGGGPKKMSIDHLIDGQSEAASLALSPSSLSAAAFLAFGFALALVFGAAFFSSAVLSAAVSSAAFSVAGAADSPASCWA